MSFQVEALLRPLSADAPCGESLKYKYTDLLDLAQIKADSQSGAESEPDWRQVRDLALGYFEKGKHLEVAVILTLSALENDGFPGLRDGLQVLKGLLEQYWDDVEPRLDKDDNNDAGERINAFAMMLVPRGTFGDRFRFPDRVFAAPLCDSRVSGKMSLRDIAIASGVIKLPTSEVAPDPNAPGPPSRAAIDAAFDESEVATLERFASAAEEGLAAAIGIENVFKTKCPNEPFNLEDLKAMLKDAGLQIRRRLTARAAAAAGRMVGDAGGDAGAAGADLPREARREGLSGEVRTPAEVKAAIAKIAAYYERHEPSSPVALVVRAAEKLVNIKFEEVYKTFKPEAIDLLLEIANRETENK
jgi:type VI secretion system protein ImpA